MVNCTVFILSFSIISSCSSPETFNPVKVDWPQEPPRFTQVTGDHATGLGLDTDGYVWTWGMLHDFNTWKKETTTGMVPVWKEDGTRFGNIKSISNAGHTCMAIDSAGVLWSWGSDRVRQERDSASAKNHLPSTCRFPG